ncbi:MAG TPA: acyclic terpene utilization AtuA family protein [Pseudonocardia sp.]|nr:acyclic terpene utilization AtuA family protein [Pseudonocardia sp.]
MLRIGNCSGYYGDRADAMAEMLGSGELDVLTGDYLAELTMLILGRDRARDPELGYAKTFLVQLEQCLGTALDAGVALVANGGGLNPGGLADAIRELAARLGLHPRVAHVEGDDLLSRAGELGLGEPVAVNAYLGGRGIAECLAAGADVVVTGRVTDASLVVGPAAAHFGWLPSDLDALAGGVVAGHIIECGTQATGGNYAFFTDLADRDLRRPGFPIAEVYRDGSCVITKHPGTGGAVTEGTVTAQLLYEIGGARYAGPDVTARFDSVEIRQVGPDRVAVSGARGEPPPPELKVGVNRIAGYRNEAGFYLTGLDIEAKADLIRSQLVEFDSESDSGCAARWTLARTDHPDSDTQEAATALLHCVVRSPDPKAVGRRFATAVLELGLASYPGLHRPGRPGEPVPYGAFEALYLDASTVPHIAVLPDGTRRDIPPAPVTTPLRDTDPPEPPPPPAVGPCRTEALGTVAGARSGDKGGSANVGVWARTERAWPWLANTLTVEEFQRLLPETATLPVTRHVLPNMCALNFVVDGLLGAGVAENARHDPQAKAVGEWLRSRLLPIPEELLQ